MAECRNYVLVTQAIIGSDDDVPPLQWQSYIWTTASLSYIGLFRNIY